MMALFKKQRKMSKVVNEDTQVKLDLKTIVPRINIPKNKSCQWVWGAAINMAFFIFSFERVKFPIIFQPIKLVKIKL